MATERGLTADDLLAIHAVVASHPGIRFRNIRRVALHGLAERREVAVETGRLRYGESRQVGQMGEFVTLIPAEDGWVVSDQRLVEVVRDPRTDQLTNAEVRSVP